MPSIRIGQTAADLHTMRPAWSALAVRDVDADPDVILDVIRTRAEALEPYVLLLEDDGEPRAMLVARLEQRRFAVKFGYTTLLRPRLRCLTVVAGGAAGAPAHVELLVERLLQALADREADAAFLHRVAVGSPLHCAATTLPSPWSRQRITATSQHRALDLPTPVCDVDSAIRRNIHKDLRYCRRRLERAHGDAVELRRYRDATEVDRALAELEHVAAKSYQRGLGAGFSMEQDASLVRLGFERGWMRAWMLLVDGEPCAFELGAVRDGTFVSGAKAFNPALRKLEVGKVAQLAMLEDLCADPEVEVIDFGFGDAAYKERLSNRSWDETDVTIYGPTLRGVLTNLASTVVLGADQAARRLAGQERIALVKRRWRTLRTPRTSGIEPGSS